MQTEKPKTDWFIFTTTFVFLVVTVSALLVAPSASQNAIKGMLSYITSELGLVFIWFGIVVLFFLLFVALSPIGRIKLGLPNDRPEHSQLSWVAMLLDLILFPLLREESLLKRLNLSSDIFLKR